MALSKDQIIGKTRERKREVVRIAVPEWDGEICLRRLDAADLKSTGLMAKAEPDADTMLRVLARSICDEQGDLLFSDRDLKTIGEIEAAVALEVFKEAGKINGLGAEPDEAEAEAAQVFDSAQRQDNSTD